MSDLETASSPQGESPFFERRIPRLSILHLMLWTLCSSVYLTLLRTVYSLEGDTPSGYASIRDASSVLQGIIAGAVFAGASVLVSVRVRVGPPMLSHPGHWILFISAIVQLIYLPVLVLVVSMLLISRLDFIGTAHFGAYALVFIVPAVAYAIAARQTAARRWRLLFVALAVMAVGQCLYLGGIGLMGGRFGPSFAILSAIRSWSSLLLAGAVLTISIVELAAGVRRDWLHWTGVVTHVSTSSVALLWMVGSWFIR